MHKFGEALTLTSLVLKVFIFVIVFVLVPLDTSQIKPGLERRSMTQSPTSLWVFESIIVCRRCRGQDFGMLGLPGEQRVSHSYVNFQMVLSSVLKSCILWYIETAFDVRRASAQWLTRGLFLRHMSSALLPHVSMLEAVSLSLWRGLEGDNRTCLGALCEVDAKQRCQVTRTEVKVPAVETWEEAHRPSKQPMIAYV